jgi:hypothetical protein
MKTVEEEVVPSLNKLFERAGLEIALKALMLWVKRKLRGEKWPTMRATLSLIEITHMFYTARHDHDLLREDIERLEGIIEQARKVADKIHCSYIGKCNSNRCPHHSLLYVLDGGVLVET